MSLTVILLIVFVLLIVTASDFSYTVSYGFRVYGSHNCACSQPLTHTCDAEAVMMSYNVKLGTGCLKGALQDGHVLVGIREMQSRHTVCPHVKDMARCSVSKL